METGDWRLAMDTPSAQAGLSSFQPSPTSRSYDICASSPSTPRNVQRMFWVRCIVPTGLCVKGRMTCMASSAVDRRRRKCPVCLKVYTRMSSSTRHKVSGPTVTLTPFPYTCSMCCLLFQPPIHSPPEAQGKRGVCTPLIRHHQARLFVGLTCTRDMGKTRRARQVAQESG